MRQVRGKGDREECRNRSTPLPALRRLRQSQGLSQRDLASQAKVSSGTVYRLENGFRGAYPTTVRKLAAALGVPPADLVREHHPPED